MAMLLAQHASAAGALVSRKVCVWDPVGNHGPVMAFFGDLVPTAIRWGLDLDFLPYADENKAAQDLREGKCSMAIVTAIEARAFSKFAGTLDAIGGITSERGLHMTLATLTRKRAGELMSDGEFEVVAAMPVGSMYAYVRDRRITSIETMRSKKIASLNNDIQTRMLAKLADATAVPETLSSFANSFNQGRLDVVIMPALAYNTFELYKGLGETGGIIEDRMFYGMLEIVARKSEFDADFGDKMRHYAVNRLKAMLDMIAEAESTIPKHYWIKTTPENKAQLEAFFKDIRLTLMVEDKFDKRTLSMLYKIRCNTMPERAECSAPGQ